MSWCLEAKWDWRFLKWKFRVTGFLFHFIFSLPPWQNPHSLFPLCVTHWHLCMMVFDAPPYSYNHAGRLVGCLHSRCRCTFYDVRRNEGYDSPISREKNKDTHQEFLLLWWPSLPPIYSPSPGTILTEAHIPEIYDIQTAYRWKTICEVMIEKTPAYVWQANSRVCQVVLLSFDVCLFAFLSRSREKPWKWRKKFNCQDFLSPYW